MADEPKGFVADEPQGFVPDAPKGLVLDEPQGFVPDAPAQPPVLQDLTPPPAAIQPQEAPGFLSTLTGGARYDTVSPQGMARIVEDAYLFSGATPESIKTDSEKKTLFDMAKNEIIRGAREADKSGKPRQFGQALLQSAVGANSLGAMLGRLPVRAVAGIMGDDSMANDLYHQGLRESFYQRAYNAQTGGVGTAGTVVGALADPVGLLGAEVIGLGVKGAQATKIGAKILGTPGAQNLLQKGAEAAVHGVVEGAAYGGAEAASGTGNAEEVAKAAAKGVAVGSVLGGASTAVGGGLSKLSKVAPVENALTRLRHVGAAVQDRLIKVDGGIDALHFLTGSTSKKEKLGELTEQLSASGIDANMVDAVKSGKFNKLEPQEQMAILESLPNNQRGVAALLFKDYSKIVEGGEMLKAFAKEKANNLPTYQPKDADIISGRLDAKELRSRMGDEQWNDYKIIDQNSLSSERGIDKAIEKLKSDNSLQPEVKKALQEALDYKKQVYEKGREIATDFGLDNANLEGFSHRHRLDGGVDELDSPDITDRVTGKTSRSSMKRQVEVTPENVDAYSDDAVQHYVDNFAENHMSGANGERSLISTANKLPEYLAQLKKQSSKLKEGEVKNFSLNEQKRADELSNLAKSHAKREADMVARQNAEMVRIKGQHAIDATEIKARQEALDSQAASFGNTPMNELDSEYSKLIEIENATAAEHARDLADLQKIHAKETAATSERHAAESAADKALKDEAIAKNETADKQINDLIADLNQGKETSVGGILRGQEGSKTTGTSGLLNLMAMHINKSNANPLEKKLAMDAAEAYINRTMNPYTTSELYKTMSMAQRIANGLSPAALLSGVLDPLTMISSGSTMNTLKALGQQIKAPGVDKILQNAGEAALAPVKTIMAVAHNDWRKALSLTGEHINAIQGTLHHFMDMSNMNASVFDIAGGKPNATKWRNTFGQAAYERALIEARTWSAKPAGTRGEMPPELQRLTTLIANEKLPTTGVTTNLSQTALFNNLTRGETGKFATMNLSFATNKLANTMRLANELLQTSTDKEVRKHAAIGMAQLLLFSMVIEHAFFQKIQEVTSNELDKKKEQPTSPLEDLLPVGRITRGTPPIWTKAAGIGKEIYNEATKPQGFIKANETHLVNPVAAKVTGFIPLAARGAKTVSSMIRQPTKTQEP